MSARKHFARSTISFTSLAALVSVSLLSGVAPSTASPGSRDQRDPRIAFSRVDPAIGGFALWSTTPAGTDQRRLTQGQAYFPAWSPDRSHLLFDFPDENGDEQIGRVDADGSDLRQLTDLPGVSEAADYSPNGREIVFDRYVPQDDQPFFTSLWVMNADGSDAHALFGPSSTTFDVEPDYSPDGSKIVFSRIHIDPTTEQETYALFVTAADGSWQRQITPFADGVEHPHWSPEGRWIIYNVESNENPNNGIYLVRPSGHGLHRILRSNEELIVYKPDFAPDGKRVVLGCFVVAEAQEDICMMNANGRGLHRIVRTPAATENFPVWGS